MCKRHIAWFGIVASLALVGACKKTPATSRPEDTAPPALAQKGAIPRADGGVAMQRDDRYAELRFGRAVLGPDGLVVHLTEAPLPCTDWPRPPQLSITFHLSAGPDDTFFAGQRVTTQIDRSSRGFGHVKMEPFELAEGKHVKGQIDYADPGSGNHNGFEVKPSRGAGTFDVVLCPVAEADKAALKPPSTLPADAPLAFTIDGATSAPKTVLVMAEFDDGDSEPWVSRIEAFEQAGVSCDDPYVKSGADMKLYFGLQAADLGKPQPARFEPDPRGSQTSRESRLAWVRFEPFELASATTAKASVAAFARAYDTPKGATTPEHLPPASLAGTFEAKVCRFGSKFGKPYL